MQRDIRNRIAEIVHKPPLSVESESQEVWLAPFDCFGLEVYKRDLVIGCMEPQIIPGVMYIDPQKKTNKGLFSVKDKPYGLDLI